MLKQTFLCYSVLVRFKKCRKGYFSIASFTEPTGTGTEPHMHNGAARLVVNEFIMRQLHAILIHPVVQNVHNHEKKRTLMT